MSEDKKDPVCAIVITQVGNVYTRTNKGTFHAFRAGDIVEKCGDTVKDMDDPKTSYTSFTNGIFSQALVDGIDYELLK